MAKDKLTGPATLARDEPAKKTTPTPVAAAKPAATRPTGTEAARTVPLPFGRQNYTLMLIGIGTILAGFFIMSLDKEEFGFGFLGLTLGPIVVMAGFMLEFFAILVRPKS